MTRAISTRLITCPRTGALIRVPAHYLAPPRLRASDVRRLGGLDKAKAELWGQA